MSTQNYQYDRKTRNAHKSSHLKRHCRGKIERSNMALYGLKVIERIVDICTFAKTGFLQRRQLILIVVHKSCVMLTKWVFFKFSSPGNALSKFCAK